MMHYVQPCCQESKGNWDDRPGSTQSLCARRHPDRLLDGRQRECDRARAWHDLRSHDLQRTGPAPRERRTVVTFDRRGRGLSGDEGAVYDIEREFTDLAALADQVAGQQAAPVDVLGHSFGAFIALGAALRTASIRSLVAYSPGFGAEYPPGSLDQIQAATAVGDRNQVLQVMFRDVIGMPDDEIQAMRRSPVWQVRQAAAGTIGRECRADESFLRRYQGDLRGLKIPVLVVRGQRTRNPSG